MIFQFFFLTFQSTLGETNTSPVKIKTETTYTNIFVYPITDNGSNIAAYYFCLLKLSRLVENYLVIDGYVSVESLLLKATNTEELKTFFQSIASSSSVSVDFSPVQKYPESVVIHSQVKNSIETKYNAGDSSLVSWSPLQLFENPSITFSFQTKTEVTTWTSPSFQNAKVRGTGDFSLFSSTFGAPSASVFTELFNRLWLRALDLKRETDQSSESYSETSSEVTPTKTSTNMFAEVWFIVVAIVVVVVIALLVGWGFCVGAKEEP